MRPALGVGYLLCRAADSIADTDVVSPSERMMLLTEFNRLMLSFPFDKQATTQFVEKLKNSVSSSTTIEARLLNQMEKIFTLLGSLPKTDQVLVQEIVVSVISGMKMDLELFGDPSEQVRALPHKKSFESYLGWIGGEPGRFWTKITLDHQPQLKIKNPIQWREKGFRFGTGLQLVNILRDLPSDLKRGRCYIPADLLSEYDLTASQLLENESQALFLPLYHELIDEATKRLKNGMEYLQEISPSYFRLRAAVWWPLSLGMKTLSLLRNRFTVLGSERPRKISRWSVWSVVGSSPLVLASQKGMEYSFKRMAKDVA